MIKFLLCSLGALVVLGLPVQLTSLSKSEQTSGWHSVKEVHLAERGFTHWKSTPAGFLLKNSDFQIACRGHIIDMQVQCSAPMPELAISFLEKTTSSKMVLEKESTSTTTKKARFRAIEKQSQKKAKYTPLQDKVLEPLKPELHLEHENNDGVATSWGRNFNIDDHVNEGEQDNGDMNSGQESDLDIRLQKRFFDRIDVGPGNAVDQENERDTQHKPTYYKQSVRKNEWKSRAGLIDTPYVDAGVERVVNQHMFKFFKKHPQYHTPKALWITADRWRKWMLMSGDESNSHGLYGDKRGPASPEGGAGSPDMSEESMWKRCPEKVHKEWPETPRVQCKHFAVSPVGFWGCQSLFEDGTCQKTKFFDNIRWDGLDAYPIPKGNPDAEKGEQYNNPNGYHDEILPGGNPE